MKKILVLTLFFAMLGVTSSVMSADTKIAIVDVPLLVSKSAQVQALKKEQQTKMLELEKWIKNVRADVEKQQTKEGKEQLIKKYDAEFVKKQQSIKENYTKKLQTIDKNISSTITSEAKKRGYDLVLTKGTVLYGGDDITEYLIKVVK